MSRSEFKSCFISAPFGVDTTILRHELQEKGIRWRDQTSVTPGSSWLDVLEREISRSDFVCAVIPESHGENVLFELGFAYAKRKPILAFIGASLQLPSEILSLTYVRSDPTNPKAVRSALSAFLQHANVATSRRARPSAKQFDIDVHFYVTPQGADFEVQTANLLKSAGFIVAEGNKSRDKGADFAVWIDELENSLGNPLLVEVKAGDLSASKLRDAATELRNQVLRTRGRCALLVYWDRENREFPVPRPEWPLVLQLSGASLSRLISTRSLARELIRLRNEAVHGGQ